MAETNNKSSSTADKEKEKGKDTKKSQKESKPEPMSAEDTALLNDIILLVDRLKDSNGVDLHHSALESLRVLIRTSTSSMTSVPKPLKFLRDYYSDLVEIHKQWTNESNKRFLADILSILAMTIPTNGEKSESLKYRLIGSAEPIDSWGHEYVRHIASDIGKEYAERQEKNEDASELYVLADEIVPFCMSHNAEADACDLLMELEAADKLVQFVDEKNFDRVCLYLTSCVNYVSEPDDVKILQAVLAIYRKLDRYPEALITALRLNDDDAVAEIFESVTDMSIKKQMAFILAKHQHVYQPDEASLLDIVNNVNLSGHFLHLAHDLEVLDPKTPEEIYKSHLDPMRQYAAGAADTARQNLASTFVNAFVNAGFKKDKLLLTENSDWVSKNKDQGMMSATASIGMLLLWEVEEGLAQIDKFLYSKDDNIRAGALLAIGLINAGVKNECDPAKALLEEFFDGNHPTQIRNAAILGLAIAYAGTRNESVSELIAPFLSDSNTPEIVAYAALAIGCIHIGTCHGEYTSLILQSMDYEDSPKKDFFARYLALGLGLLYLGRGAACEVALEAVKSLKHVAVLLEACAYAGSGNVLKIQKMMQICTDHLDSEKESDLHQAFAVLGIALIGMGEEVGSEMSLRLLNHLMHYGEPVIRRVVPLATALLCPSNPQEVNTVESLSKYSHDNDAEVAQSAVLAMGIIGAGTNNARLAQLLRQLSSYYSKDSNLLFLVRIAQGLVHMGKGTLSLTPYHSNRLLLSPVALCGLLVTLVAGTNMKASILSKHHYLLYFLALSMSPRMLITVDEDLNPISVSVRVGQAVDTVGQAGRPKTITGFQTHNTPVLLSYGERAELATEEYISLSPILESVVIVKKNPEYVQKEIDKMVK